MLEFCNSSKNFLLLLILASCYTFAHLLQETLVFDKQIVLNFEIDKYKTFKYHQSNNESCTLIVTACSSPIEWNVFQSNLRSNSTSILLHSSITIDQETFNFPIVVSMEYVIKLKTNDNGYGFLFARQTQNLYFKNLPLKSLQMKWKSRKEMIVRWPRRLLAQDKSICLVSSTNRHHKTLCSFLDLSGYQELLNHTLISGISSYQSVNKDRFVNCTNTTAIKLNFSQMANDTKQIIADAFVIDKKTNFVQWLGGNTSSILTSTVPLKENKMTFVNLKEPIAMSLKVQKNSFSNSVLDIYIVPCNLLSRIDVEIFFDGNLLDSRKGITAFSKISVPNVQRKKNYIIYMNRRDTISSRGNTKIDGVQVFATTLSSLFNPYPEMPRRPAVKEYKALRTCHSVAIGWIPPNGLHTAYYCMIINKGKVDYRRTNMNQCQLYKTNRNEEMRTLVSKTCKKMKHTARISVITQKIDKLSPGTFYSIQIIVRKPKGKALPYELLQVRTKSRCN